MIIGSSDLYISKLYVIIGTPEDKTLLDLCCGEMPHTRSLKFKSHFGVDILDWPNRPKEIPFEQADLRIWEPKQHYDIAILSDGIEHFSKIEGRNIIKRMESWAALPIIFAPIGNYEIAPNAVDPHSHKCGWTAEEFQQLGWQTTDYPNWHPTLNLGAFFAWKRQ